MSQSVNRPSSSTSGGGRWRRRGGTRERGFPKYCRCGEEAVIRTSKTVKNPGRLFHCCPYGSEEDNYHLFTWTDECMVDEVYDLKDTVTDLRALITELIDRIGVLEKEIEVGKKMLESEKNKKERCVVM